MFFAVEFEDNEDLENNAGASAKKPFTAVISKLECLSLSATSIQSRSLPEWSPLKDSTLSAVSQPCPEILD